MTFKNSQIKILIFSFILIGFCSCSTSKQVMKCPDFKQSKDLKLTYSKKTKKQSKHSSVKERDFAKKSLHNQEVQILNGLHFFSTNSDTITLSDLELLVHKDFESKVETKLSTKEKILVKALKNRIKKTSKATNFTVNNCSKITLKSGSIIEADIIQINPTGVKYRRCGKPNSPEIVIDKRTVLNIQAEDGYVLYQAETPDQTEIKDGYNPQQYSNNSELVKEDPMAVASLIMGVSGLVIGFLYSIGIAFLMGILAFIFGAVSSNRIAQNQYSGKGIANVGMICGSILIILGFIGIVGVLSFL